MRKFVGVVVVGLAAMSGLVGRAFAALAQRLAAIEPTATGSG